MKRISNSYDATILKFQPTDELLELNKELGNKHLGIPYEIEHLLSINYWEEMVKMGMCVERSQGELIDVIKDKMTFSESVDELLKRLSITDEIKNTILWYNPKDEKKTSIANLAIKLYDEGMCLGMFEGFKRTIEKIEKILK